jgi:PAS domain S-box-containing protein
MHVALYLGIGRATGVHCTGNAACSHCEVDAPNVAPYSSSTMLSEEFGPLNHDNDNQVEADLKRSEAYLAEGQKISHTGTWALNLTSGEVYWSQEVFRIYGLDPATTKLSREMAFELIHPEDRPGVREALEKSLREKSNYSVEHRAIVADNTKYLHSLGRPVLNKSGDLIEYVGTVVDLTERKLAEIRLREANERVEMILNSITDQFVALSKDWRLTYLNSRAAEQMKLLGKDPASLIGKVLWEEFPDVPNEKALRRVMEERVAITDELYYAPLGQWVENYMYPSQDGGIVTFQKYITERKRAEDDSRNSERRFRLLVETIPHQVWSYRADGTLDFFNQRWLDYTGVTWEEAQRTGGHDLLHPDDRERVDKIWRSASARGEQWEVELRLQGRDGRYRRFLSRGAPFCSESGETLQWFGTNTDIEDRKQAEEALRGTQSELAYVTRLTTMGELMATLAHELNQPLAAAVANSSAALRWLEHDEPNTGEGILAIRRVLRDTTRMGDVIASVRNLLKKSVTEHTRIDVESMIQEVLVSLDLEITKYKISVRQSCSDDLPQPLGSKVELQQVMLNLIVNGIEAMALISDWPRELTIMCDRREFHASAGVCIAVKDSGVGLSTETFNQLFESFYTTKPSGLGMGLSISRSIVQAHGGVLWAEPNAGHGATFRFLLPV